MDTATEGSARALFSLTGFWLLAVWCSFCATTFALSTASALSLKEQFLLEMTMQLPFWESKRNITVKKEARTDQRFGCRPEERPVEQLIHYGVINLNKPAGPSSHQVSDYVQRILGIAKAGHSGTLDPHVSGVLPIALARATRIAQALLNAGKEYVTLMHLHHSVSEAVLRETFRAFQGKIMQLPPVRSAVKRQERVREIYYLDILEIDNNDALFRVGCEAGTYIRKLVHDFGLKIGGAHMAQLVRTRAGPFCDRDWHSLQDLADAYAFYKEEGNEKAIRRVILPFERAVDHLSKVWVFDNVVNNLCHGAGLGVQGISKLHDGIREKELVAVMTLKDELICLGAAMLSSADMLANERGLAVAPEKVFMERDTYSTYK